MSVSSAGAASAAGTGGGWARGGASEVVRRAHPASGAHWNVQVVRVRGAVNGRCLWNAAKALSLGLMLMALGAAMATIGYYADQLSVAQEVRGNHTVRVKNESRGFHLNNLSYAGPIVMGVGGFIVVAACVMTFEARDSAAKVVPARFKMSATGPPVGLCPHGGRSGHGSLRTAGSQTGASVQHSHQHTHAHYSHASDRRALTQSFMCFSRGLALDPHPPHRSSLKVPQPQMSINRSPSAPDLAVERGPPPGAGPYAPAATPAGAAARPSPRRTFAAAALLNPGLLHRHALSVDEAAGSYRSHESLQHGGPGAGGSGSQGSMAMDLHLDCPVTLRVRDRRRGQLRRQRKVDEEAAAAGACAAGDAEPRRGSRSLSPRPTPAFSHHRDHSNSGSPQRRDHPTHCPAQYTSPSRRRRSSNASDCTHRARARRRECAHARGRLERAISSDSRLAGAEGRAAVGGGGQRPQPCCYHSYNPSQASSRVNSTEQEPARASSVSDVAATHAAVVHTGPGSPE